MYPGEYRRSLLRACSARRQKSRKRSKPRQAPDVDAQTHLIGFAGFASMSFSLRSRAASAGRSEGRLALTEHANGRVLECVAIRRRQRSGRLLPGENVIGRDPAASCGSIRRPSRVVTPVSSSIAGVPGLKTWSRNGTTIRDRRVMGKCSLRDGDVMRMGTTRLVYRAAAGVGSIETAAPSAR